MDHLQQRCTAEGLPKAVTQLLLSSATPQSTSKGYDSAWGEGIAGVLEGKLIQFQQILKTF